MKLIYYLTLTFAAAIFSTYSGAGQNQNTDGSGSDTICKAAFSITLDSLTSFPYFYHLQDRSTGNINIWHWDFGDGTTSSEQHPSHQYNKPGTYTICLTVADINDPNGCTDKYCQQLTTLDYYSLGGLVYAGEYPLNNPVVTGDTGVASLFRIVNEEVVYLEDHYFQDYGYYWFGYLIPGEYILKLGLTPGSPNYKEYFTTYYGDHISWTKAEIITVSNMDIFEAEVHLEPVHKLPAGMGSIKGYVHFEQVTTLVPPISQTGVILMDSEHTPLMSAHPDANGYFEITGIPFDTYYLTADATGRPSTTLKIILSGNEPVASGVSLTVFGSNVSFVREVSGNGISLIRIYPNPVKDQITVSYYSGVSVYTEIKIFDLSGKCHYTQSERIVPGMNQVKIAAASLPRGVYLLVLQPEEGFFTVSSKFVK